MNWSDPMSEESAPEEGSPEEDMLKAEDSAQASDQALYPGDSGELSLDARRVLVQLLAGPSLDGQRHYRPAIPTGRCSKSASMHPSRRSKNTASCARFAQAKIASRYHPH